MSSHANSFKKEEAPSEAPPLLAVNNIEVIYIIVSIPSGEISIDEFKPYLDNVCFKSENKNSITSSHVLIKCKD